VLCYGRPQLSLVWLFRRLATAHLVARSRAALYGDDAVCVTTAHEGRWADGPMAVTAAHSPSAHPPIRPSYSKRMIIIAEDSRFKTHHGIDFVELRDAWAAGRASRREHHHPTAGEETCICRRPAQSSGS